jgi:diguanylate cyclase (GGDEF)-like protein
MRKRQVSRGAKLAPPPRRVPADERHVAAVAERGEASPRRRRSAAMELAAEVERLERELAAARAEMAALAARADTDPLTDLLNRRGFERELKRALAHGKRYGTRAALIYLDLDRFKPVNDRHGHAAGDAMLKAVGDVLTRHVRASDLVARLGGDEFAVLLWHISEADAQAKALELEAAVDRTTATHSGACLSVGASAGVAPLLPLDAAADVLARADQAMYARKAVRQRDAASRSPGVVMSRPAD